MSRRPPLDARESVRPLDVRGLVALGAWSRFPAVRRAAWKFLRPEPGTVVPPPRPQLTILLGGDVNFDPEVRMMYNLGLYRLRQDRPSLSFGRRAGRRAWRALCRRACSPELFGTAVSASFDEFAMEKPEGDGSLTTDSYYTNTVNVADGAIGPDGPADPSYPFGEIGSLLRDKRVVFVNLETPLTTHPRPNGLFVSHPRYAEAMRQAGITVVGVANNHIFDAGEIGFRDTLQHLRAAGLTVVGAGDDLAAARRGQVIDVDGLKLAFLAYTQFCNSRFASLAATYPGILPLDRKLMVDDIGRARAGADFVLVSLHWGFENQPNVHPRQREIAHLLIDAGADCIVGHHPHVPHAVEIYQGRPILYSLGNFIFPHFRRDWRDNFLAEVLLTERRLEGVRIYPISGTGKGLFRPAVLGGNQADSFLEDLQLRSLIFGTPLAVADGLGYVPVGEAFR
jgi:poly-gamma-glutamate capsule biosynthesis protein CapA/YwtB (metallophosphatase superfamily)